jgi:hypothetical protein
MSGQSWSLTEYVVGGLSSVHISCTWHLSQGDHVLHCCINSHRLRHDSLLFGAPPSLVSCVSLLLPGTATRRWMGWCGPPSSVGKFTSALFVIFISGWLFSIGLFIRVFRKCCCIQGLRSPLICLSVTCKISRPTNGKSCWICLLIFSPSLFLYFVTGVKQ